MDDVINHQGCVKDSYRHLYSKHDSSYLYARLLDNALDIKIIGYIMTRELSNNSSVLFDTCMWPVKAKPMSCPGLSMW